MRKWARYGGIGLAAIGFGLSDAAQAAPSAAPSAAPVPLSVMTYNVHGLPWPLARGRNAAFDAMTVRLRKMRREGDQPHIVVLQEAFTPEARAVGGGSGYRYIAYGPSATDRSPVEPSARDRKFAAQASFLSGERSGRMLGSGLQILSDYPILAVRTQPFPVFACAGYDCLANKGILMVLVSVPGSSTPVVVSTVHFNSRRSSGVSDERADYAYRRQWDATRQFLATSGWRQYPMVFAGDFNVGKSVPRRATFLTTMADLWKSHREGPVRDALRACRRTSCKFPALAEEALTRAKDWQLFASTRLGSLVAERVQVPFGRAADGSMLSDHIGYSTTYRLSTHAPIRLAESTPRIALYPRSK